MKRIIQRASPDRAQCFNFLMCPCHRHSLESFLRQYPRQLPVWRHRLFISHILWILSLPAQSFQVISVRFLDGFVVHNEPNLKKKASMNHCAEISGGSKRERESREAANCFCKSQLCLSLPALEHWACKSFSCEGLGPASIGTVSKEHCLFQKTEGTSLRGECWLFALSPATLSLLSALLLSALGVIPARAGSVVCSGIRGSLDRSWKGRSVSQTPRE